MPLRKLPAADARRSLTQIKSAPAPFRYGKAMPATITPRNTGNRFDTAPRDEGVGRFAIGGMPDGEALTVTEIRHPQCSEETEASVQDDLLRLRELRRALRRVGGGTERYRAANALFCAAERLYRSGRIGRSVYRVILSAIDQATLGSPPRRFAASARK